MSAFNHLNASFSSNIVPISWNYFLKLHSIERYIIASSSEETTLSLIHFIITMYKKQVISESSFYTKFKYFIDLQRSLVRAQMSEMRFRPV